MARALVGRNDSCPCGSGRKFKKCCLSTVEARMMPPRPAQPNGERWVFLQTPAQVAAARKQAALPLTQPQLARPANPSPGGGEMIEATDGHPFWVISGEDLDQRPITEHCPTEAPDAAIPGRWVSACAMRVGDVVLTQDGRRVAILDASVRPARTKVYNLQVEGLGNYAVGHSGILVHNTSRRPRPEKPAVPTERDIIKGIRSSGKFDATVASEAEARRLVQTALPHACELPHAVPGSYPQPASGVRAWFQVQPAEPHVGNNLPHIKYEDWTGGKKRTGGSWGHIFFPPPPAP